MWEELTYLHSPSEAGVDGNAHDLSVQTDPNTLGEMPSIFAASTVTKHTHSLLQEGRSGISELQE